jgi:glutaminyl-peptide cyclotransferase
MDNGRMWTQYTGPGESLPRDTLFPRLTSLHSSRNLVSQWKTSFWKPSTLSSRDELGPRRFKSFTQPTRRIDTIEHFVLLDLLGTPNPQIPSYYKDTSWLHSELMDLEKRLRDSQAFTPDGRNHGSPFMSSKPSWGQIEDDHLPFLANGVPILHLIPNPFPKVWHLLSVGINLQQTGCLADSELFAQDDADALDYPTNYSWAMLMRAFVVEYLGLDVADAKAPRGLEKAHEELVSRANAIYLSAPSVDNFNNRFPASGSSNHQTRPTITVS